MPTNSRQFGITPNDSNISLSSNTSESGSFAVCSPKYGKLFEQVEKLLKDYIDRPSVQLRNHIAAKLYPYYKSVCRWIKYQTSPHQEQLFSFDDAVQECYLAVVRAIDRCHDKDNPLAYVIAWIKGTMKTYLTHKKIKDSPLPEMTDYLAARLGLHCSGIVVDDETPIALILGEIGELSPAVQEYIHLVWIRGNSPSDVAFQKGVSRSAVSNALKKARKKLQGRLKNYDFVRNYLKLPDERDRAWQLRMQGIERQIIAERLGLGENVLAGWFERDKVIRHECRSFEKIYICISPSGEEFQTINLTQFALDRGLKPSAMLSVANGKQKHCENWTVRKSV